MEVQTIELVIIEPEAAPAAPVLATCNCPGYGKELPPGWRCPRCAVAEQCYRALLAAQANGRNGNGRERDNGRPGA